MLENKVVRVLLSIVIAFGLWFYVITAVSTEQDQKFTDISVTFQGETILEEKGLMITTEQTPKVDLQLYGKRSDLSKLNSANITVVVDLSKINEAGTHAISTGSISYPADVRADSFTVLERNPGSVTLTVEQKLKKEVPVQIAYLGSVGEDFIADKENVILDYATVSIEGPASTLEQITQARIEVNLEGRRESFSDSYVYTLCDKNDQPVDAFHVETNVAAVNLTMYIQQVKEIPVVVTIVEGGGATGSTTVVDLSHETLKVSGNETVLGQLDELLLGTIELGKIAETTSLNFPVVLPTGVTNLSAVSEVTVTVSFPELSTKNFTITDISAIHVPEDMVAEIVTQSMQVTVRGPRALMSQLTAENITVTVDLKDAQTGTFTVKGKVTLDSQFSACGAIKADSISVTLRSALEELTDDPEGNG